jgi:hypothetical protein
MRLVEKKITVSPIGIIPYISLRFLAIIKELCMTVVVLITPAYITYYSTIGPERRKAQNFY